MLPSIKQKESRKHKLKGRNIKVSNIKPKDSVEAKDSNVCEIDEAKEKNVLKGNLMAEKEEINKEKCQATDKKIETSALELNDTMLNKKENSSLFLEDGKDLDVMHLFEMDSDIKNTVHPELVNANNIQPSNLKMNSIDNKKESNILENQLKPPDYQGLLNYAKEIMLLDSTTKPSAPDFTSIGGDIQESSEDSPLKVLYTDPGEEVKCVKEEIDILELKSKLHTQNLEGFSEKELAEFYYNSELNQVHDFITDFVKEETNPEARHIHPFYELLSKYLKAKNSLQSSNHQLKLLDEKLDKHVNEMWSVWNEFEVHKTAKCADGNLLTLKKKFMQAYFNEEVYGIYKNTVSEIRSILFEIFKRDSFNSLRYKFKIELYIESLLTSCREFTSLNESSSISIVHPSTDFYFQQCLSDLRISIGILFFFQRKQKADVCPSFLQESRQWLTDMVSVLLRTGNWKDHLFILNHILRCPGGIGKWASCYIQFPETSLRDPFSNPIINHMVASLSVLLQPIDQRENFMSEWKIITAPDENSWVVIDSEDENEETASVSGSLKENDIVMLLNQIPLKNLFTSILGLDNGKLDPQKVTFNHLMKTFSFCLDLIKILYAGLQVYSAQRYKQFVKRLGRLISHIIECVTYEVDLFLSNGPETNTEGLDRIQVEYDNFFMKSTTAIFSSRIHGTWQYLTAVPYHRASESAILELYNTLQLTEMDDRIILRINMVEFEEKFVKLPESEQFYLLSSFTSMALARNLSELEFIVAVVHQLLYIGFLSNLTKENCYKNVKSLLLSLCSKHSFLISEILRRQNQTFILKENRNQSLTIYLWQELPVNTWQPAFEDLNILSSWLLKPVQCLQNELARIILKSLNYAVEQEDLFLLPETHQMVAHIVMKACERFYKEEETNIIKNVSNFVGLQEPEQALHLWSWNILLRLRLHLFDQSPASVKNMTCNLHDSLKKIPELASKKQLHELVEQKNPIACFIALMTTTLGHSVPVIYNEGFPLLEILISARKYEAAIACIECMTFMFLECPESLYRCTYFTSVLSQLIYADYPYLKLAKTLKVPEMPGRILLCLENMIQNQICSCDELGINRSKVIELWIKSLTKLPLWIEEPGVLYLVDSLCKITFFDRVASSRIRDIFCNLLLEISSPAESKSSLATFVNWMNPKTTIPTLLPQGYNGNTVWFFLKVIEIEKEFHEKNNNLWNELLKELHTANDKKTNVDNCLKKACNSLQIPIRTSKILIIYRLCYQILETEITHPVIIVLWQKFFLLYFYRIPGLLDNGSVGDKFFHGILNQNLLKKMRSRLEETFNCFDELSKQCNKSDEKSNYFLRCKKILHAFQLWLDDPKLHEPRLSIHFLPLWYDPQLFSTIIQQNDAVWTDLIDYAKVQNEIKKSSLTWQKFKNQRTRNIVLTKSPTFTSDKSSVEKIQEGLMRYDNPLPAPSVNIKKYRLVSLPDIALESSSIVSYLRPSFRNVLDYADYFVQEMEEHIELGCDLQDLVKLLYKVKKSTVTVREKCNGYEKIVNGKKFNVGCSGPAVAVLSFEESELDRKCSDTFSKVFRNFNQKLQWSLLPPQPHLGRSIVTIEKVIEQFRTHYNFLKKHNGNEELVARLENTGTELFYNLLGLWSESVSATQPVATLFEDCINVLGKTFIVEKASECHSLLARINKYPKLIDKLQTHFNPSICEPQDFIDLYCNVKNSRSEIRVALLSRFDFIKWLCVKKPRFTEISSLISEIGSGLKSYGACPTDDMDVIKLYNSHLQHLLMHDFPEHYGEVLNLLLDGSESQTIPTSTWFTFLNSIVPEGIVFTEGKCEPSSFEPGQGAKKLKLFFTQYATHQKLLSLSNIRETMAHLANTFKTDRLKHGLCGLYPKYHYYIEPILIFCGMLSHSFIAETLKLDLGSLSVRIAHQLWPRLRDLYSPWLVPYWSKQEKTQVAKWIQELTDDKSVLLPWICSDVVFASYSCAIFIDSIRFFLDTLPGANSILSHVWVFYVTNYAHIQVKDHVLFIIHKNMLHLPWSKFFPSLQDIELMVKVVEHFIPMSHSLLGNIFVEVKWTDVVKHYSSQSDLETLSKLHVYLLHLLVKLPCEPSLKQSNEIVLLLTAAKYFSWHLVDSVNYDFVLNWFVMSCDPRIIFTDEKSEYYKVDLLILQILSICAGFSEFPIKLHSTTFTKRLMYVRAYNKWLTTANSRFKCKDSPLFKAAFVRILNKIEAISDSEKPNELAKLLSELLNVFKEEELVSVLEETLVNWLSQNRCPTMIYELLRSIALSAISPSIFGNIAEACLNSYFDSDNCRWSDINDDFITYASGRSDHLKTTLITNGNLLTLYAFVLKQCNDIANLLDKKIIIGEILQCITHVKRSEAVEPKLVLMIIHAFRIADTISQLDDIECVSILTQLSTYLNNICNDKDNGLLFTFGLRKGDNFTSRFKFVCLIARDGIIKLFQTRYAAHVEKFDEKVLHSLDPTQRNKWYQTLGQYVSTVLEEIKKVESVQDIITILKTLGFQVFKKNYLK